MALGSVFEAAMFIVACQLPTSDIDNAGHNTNGGFLAFFTAGCGAIIQAEGDGFYEGNHLVLELP